MFFYWHSQEGQSKREKETGKQYPGSSLGAHSTEQTFSLRALMFSILLHEHFWFLSLRDLPWRPVFLFGCPTVKIFFLMPNIRSSSPGSPGTSSLRSTLTSHGLHGSTQQHVPGASTQQLSLFCVQIVHLASSGVLKMGDPEMGL